MEAELRKLSQQELHQIREWLDDIIEDELQFTPEFERSIQASEQDMAEGKSARVRDPEGIYTFDLDQNKIHLLAVGHRREIYRSL